MCVVVFYEIDFKKFKRKNRLEYLNRNKKLFCFRSLFLIVLIFFVFLMKLYIIFDVFLFLSCVFEILYILKRFFNFGFKLFSYNR